MIVVPFFDITADVDETDGLCNENILKQKQKVNNIKKH